MDELLIGILSCSSACSLEGAEDVWGKRAAEACRDAGHDVVAYHVCPDDAECIEASLIEIVDVEEADVVLTVGGTGLAPSEVTPEVTEAVSTRLFPGVGEAIRAVTMEVDPRSAFSRGVAGQRGRTLIINLPACDETFDVALAWVLERLPVVAQVIGGMSEG